MNVVLIGMKHCGKTTVGRELARRWGCTFYDVDTMIEAVAACDSNQPRNVREVFAEGGEEYFHKVEGQVICDLYFKMQQPGSAAVIALGGRTALNERISELLHTIGLRVYLDVASRTLWERVARGGMPPFLSSADPEAEFLELCRARKPQYEKLADVEVNLDGLEAGAAADLVERRIKEVQSAGQ